MHTFNKEFNIFRVLSARKMAKKSFIFALILGFCSCKTYNVSVESFKKQITNQYDGNLDENDSNSTTFQYDKTKVYQAYGMDFISVKDKKGNPYNLEVLSGAQTKITLKNGKKYIFYLQSITLENDSIKGYKSYLFNLKSSIPLNQVSKIELQKDHAYQKYGRTSYEKSLTIDRKTDKIFENKGEELKDFKVKLDSVDVRIIEFRKVYYVACEFKNSTSRLKMFYFLMEDNALAKISVFEQSEFEPEIDYFRVYYLENGQFIYKKSQFLPKDFNVERNKYNMMKDDDLNFNKQFTDEFLQKLVLDIYQKIELP